MFKNNYNHTERAWRNDADARERAQERRDEMHMKDVCFHDDFRYAGQDDDLDVGYRGEAVWACTNCGAHFVESDVARMIVEQEVLTRKPAAMEHESSIGGSEACVSR
jgi:hypothetical protein